MKFIVRFIWAVIGMMIILQLLTIKQDATYEWTFDGVHHTLKLGKE